MAWGGVRSARQRRVRFAHAKRVGSSAGVAPPTLGSSWTVSGAMEAQCCQRALTEAEGRLRLLSAHLCGIIFELDSDVRFVRVWTSDPKLLAMPEKELLGHTIIETLGPELGLRHHEAARETVELGTAARYEYELDVPEGHRHFACESVAVPAPSGRGRHAVFWIRDITDQVQLRKKLLEAERLASLGTLAAGVAHEINNPLAYMMLSAEQLRSAFNVQRAGCCLAEQLDPMMTLVDMIHEGAERVRRIVRELLQLANPDLPGAPLDVRDAVSLSLELTRGMIETRARLCTEVGDVPHVIADLECLVQVFTNLLENAAEAIVPDAPWDNAIEVSVRCGGPGRVEVVFRDTGIGIPEQHARRIFEPFFTTKEHGTGLGLAICERIVTSINGEIRVEPNRSRGTVFRVVLPTVA